MLWGKLINSFNPLFLQHVRLLHQSLLIYFGFIFHRRSFKNVLGIGMNFPSCSRHCLLCFNLSKPAIISVNNSSSTFSFCQHFRATARFCFLGYAFQNALNISSSLSAFFFSSTVNSKSLDLRLSFFSLYSFLSFVISVVISVVVSVKDITFSVNSFLPFGKNHFPLLVKNHFPL